MDRDANIARIVIQLNTALTCPAPPLIRRLPLTFLAMLLPLMTAAADATAPGQTRVTPKGSIMEIRSTLEASASRELCYGVLADFDRLAEFIPGMQSSTIVSRPGESLLLRQIGRASAAFLDYDFDVTLAVTVNPPLRITFSRVAGNLEQMDGAWNIRGDERHCRIEYRADIKPAYWVPPVIGPVLMRRQVERQIDGLLAEIRRRAAEATQSR